MVHDTIYVRKLCGRGPGSPLELSHERPSSGGPAAPVGSRGDARSRAGVLVCKRLAGQVAAGFYICVCREPRAGKGIHIQRVGMAQARCQELARPRGSRADGSNMLPSLTGSCTTHGWE